MTVSPRLAGMMLEGANANTTRCTRDRIRAALINQGYDWPERRIICCWEPGVGDWFRWTSTADLGIAAGILTATGQAAPDLGAVWLGELGLDGIIRTHDHRRNPVASLRDLMTGRESR